MTATGESVWLSRPATTSATARIFCIPQAGSGTNVFAAWPARYLGVDLLPVELPGRLARFGEPVPDTITELAAALVAGLQPCLDVPYGFFGHCWSALLGYEASAQLAGTPAAPSRLYVSSQVAPQDGPVGRMLEMDDAELTVDLVSTVRGRGQQPHPQLIALYVRVLRTDVELSRRYQVPNPVRLDCPITAIGWTQDDQIRPDSMTGWTVCGPTTFIVLPGAHEEFIAAPRALLDLLLDGLR